MVGTTEGVVLGSVAVTVGRGVEPPHAANRTAVRIMVDNMSIRFDMVIDNSISRTANKYNCLD